MEMMCPDCMGPLAVRVSMARCTLHGGTFRVLFMRPTLEAMAAPVAPGAVAAAPPPPAVGGQCARHPTAAVAATCAACQSDMCATCVFPQEDGSVLCPACATASPIHGMGLNRGIRPPRPVVAPGTMCPNHPENPAVQRCATCRTALCATCDFALPGNLHLCANCATTPSDTVSSRRKKGTLWSYGLAILSMLLFVVGFAVPDVMGLMVLPALAGLGLGLSAVERRLRNPLWVWVPVAWNGLILGTFFLLVIVGLLMS